MIMFFFEILIICLLCGNVHSNVHIKSNEELDRVETMIGEAKYPSERHSVITEDGYILTLHRIPKNSRNEIPNKGVVLLLHGVFCSSADWVVMGPNISLAFLLSDTGYDVWLGNNRGNNFARKHIVWDPEKDSKQFWNFTWDEMGRYDLPAMIDYVLNTTEERTLSMVGHSRGTTIFFVLASEKPEYNAKVKSMHAMAPIAYISNVRSFVIRIAVFFKEIILILADILHLYNTDIVTLMTDLVCKRNIITMILCYDSVNFIMGFDIAQRNTTALPAIMENVPTVSSVKEMDHYAQEIRSGKFRQFDYGLRGNVREYGQITPPDYAIHNITCAVALYHSKNDWLADNKDQEKLETQLPNLVENYIVPHSKWNHMDFLYSIGVESLVYERVIEVLNHYADN